MKNKITQPSFGFVSIFHFFVGGRKTEKNTQKRCGDSKIKYKFEFSIVRVVTDS